MPRLDVNSKFRIDLDFWSSQGRDFRERLYEELCEPCKRLYPPDQEPHQVDRVDLLTGEVTRWDGAWECIMNECGRQPDFINPRMPLTRAIVRALIANGNAPMSAAELHKRIGKGTPQVILKELLGPEMEDDGIMPVSR